MPAPTLTAVGKVGTTANTTSVVITLTAGVAVGEACVVCITTTSPSAYSDSRGNGYVQFNVGGNHFIFYALATVALVAGDTITVTQSSNTAAAIAVKASGVPYAPIVSGVSEGTITSGSSSTAQSSGSTPPTRDQDYIALFSVDANAVSGDFVSVDSGYTILDTAFSTTSGTLRGLAVTYKALTGGASGFQQPTMTLNVSRSWRASGSTIPAPTARGSVGRDVVPDRSASAKLGALGTNSDLWRGQTGRTSNDAPVPVIATRQPLQTEPDYTLAS